MKKEKERGSILVLTVMSVLILSIIVIGLLTVGTTEVQTTQNFHLNKAAYYIATEGIEEIRALIMANPADTEYIDAITVSPSGNKKTESFDAGTSYPDRKFKNLGIERSYITGNLKDFLDNTPHAPETFSFGENTSLGGTRTSALRGMNLSNANIQSLIWALQVTAEAGMGSRKGYSEINAGILSQTVTGD
jgi:hypothetical protein